MYHSGKTVLTLTFTPNGPYIWGQIRNQKATGARIGVAPFWPTIVFYPCLRGQALHLRNYPT